MLRIKIRKMSVGFGITFIVLLTRRYIEQTLKRSYILLGLEALFFMREP